MCRKGAHYNVNQAWKPRVHSLTHTGGQTSAHYNCTTRTGGNKTYRDLDIDTLNSSVAIEPLHDGMSYPDLNIDTLNPPVAIEFLCDRVLLFPLLHQCLQLCFRR